EAAKNPTLNPDKAAGILTKMSIPNENMSEFELQCIEAFAKSHPSNYSMQLKAGESFFFNNSWKKSVQYFNAASELGTINLDLLTNLMIAQYNAQMFQELDATAESTITRFPNVTHGFLYGGLAKIELAAFDEAYQLLTMGKDLAINNANLELRFELSMAECQHHLGNYTAFDEQMDAVLAKHPNDATSINNYAYFLALGNRRLEKKKKMIKQALELEADNKNFMDTYGWVFFQKGDYKKAIEWLTKAVENNRDWLVFEHLGDAYAKNGQLDSAVKNWKLSQENGGKSELLLKKIKNEKYYAE
ncbi:MAG: hypothetical protein KDC92_04990, partial [Bacteroidetes bacterium]|nr:hypothetical protein [Bacteroidota bacterium]